MKFWTVLVPDNKGIVYAFGETIIAVERKIVNYEIMGTGISITHLHKQGYRMVRVETCSVDDPGCLDIGYMLKNRSGKLALYFSRSALEVWEVIRWQIPDQEETLKAQGYRAFRTGLRIYRD